MAQVKKIYRSKSQRILGGVCGGIAEYFGVDPTIVRLGWILLSLFWGVGIIMYILAWIVIPEQNAEPIAATVAKDVKESIKK